MSESERLTRLEERYAHLQLHLAEQDRVVLKLHEEVARLKTELAALQAKQTPAGGTAADLPDDERPPHY